MKKVLFIVLASIVIFSNCKKETASSEKKILGFIINGINGNINDTTNVITINFPYTYNALKNLTPYITISNNAKVKPGSRESQDFTNPVIYTVTAEDGSSQNYRIEAVITKNKSNDIIEFKLHYKNSVIEGTVDSNQVKFALLFSVTKLDALITEIKISDSATILPASGTLLSDKYTVTSESGKSKVYTTIVQNIENGMNMFGFYELPNTNITQISYNYDNLNDVYYVEDLKDLTIPYDYGYVLSNKDLSHLHPKIKISQNATITPDTSVSRDFNNDVKYTVKSESGSEKTYSIRLKKRSINFINDYYKVNFNEFKSGDIIDLSYEAICPIDSADLINMSTHVSYPCIVTSVSENYMGYTDNATFYPKYNISLPLGKYQVKVYLRNGEAILTHCKILLK